MLYLLTLSAFYGYIKSALLCYSLYKEALDKEGYKLNPYNYCILNKRINWKQRTIAWYIFKKPSHVDPKVVDNVLKKLRSFFEKMTVTRRKIHTFIGMDLRIVDPKLKVKIMY